MVLIVVAVHKGLLWSIKFYLILIKAITVVELASRPCLDLAFTLPNPLLDLAMNLPWTCLELALTLLWPCLDLALTLHWPFPNLASTLHWLYLTFPWHCLDLAMTLPLKFSPNRVSNGWDIPDMYKCHQSKCCLDKCHHDSLNLFNMFTGTYL